MIKYELLCPFGDNSCGFWFRITILRRVKPKVWPPRKIPFHKRWEITFFHEKDSLRLIGHVQKIVLVVHAQTTCLGMFVVSGYFTLAGFSFRRTPLNAMKLRDRLPGRIDRRKKCVLNELRPHFLYGCRTKCKCHKENNCKCCCFFGIVKHFYTCDRFRGFERNAKCFAYYSTQNSVIFYFCSLSLCFLQPLVNTGKVLSGNSLYMLLWSRMKILDSRL